MDAKTDAGMAGTAAPGTAAGAQIGTFVRTAAAPALPPPPATAGLAGWLRANLFSGIGSGVATVLIAVALALIAIPVIKFLFIDAVWTGADREACLATSERPVVGACWAFIADRLSYVVYGSYPVAGRWRVDTFFALLGFGTAWLLWLEAPRRDIGALYFFAVLPVASFILLHGFGGVEISAVTVFGVSITPAFPVPGIPGLPVVDTALWGGMTVTIVVAAVGIVASFPIGVVLALGRRSNLPAFRLLSTLFIEVVRGVPLITVLFMANFMLPLFIPDSWSPDSLMRALVGVALFSAAYMAEVVRAGLQAMPKGQYEAAHALGLSWWQTQRLIILPQALKLTIPNIVNNYIALFKDTSLVFFVGIFDFLKTIEVARADPKWVTPVTSATGYIFAAMVYFICCFAMSRYANGIEKRLSAGDKR
jgi:general L-amino acid transport system permease protein